MSDETNQEKPILTTRQGHPIHDNQNMRTVGERGPSTLENYHFIEKLSHFDRERLPQRLVHARRTGAHGYFEAYGTLRNEPLSKYTSAKLLQDKVKQPPDCIGSQTVIHGPPS